MAFGPSRRAQMLNQIAVWIEDANPRDGQVGQPLLAARLAQQLIDIEDRPTASSTLLMHGGADHGRSLGDLFSRRPGAQAEP